MGLGLGMDGLDLCVGLLYEHRFTMLKNMDYFIDLAVQHMTFLSQKIENTAFLSQCKYALNDSRILIG